MPIGALEVRCQQKLEEVAIISQRIRSLASRHVNNQNLHVLEWLHSRLEAIQRSSNAIFVAITKASVTGDNRFPDGLPSACLTMMPRDREGPPQQPSGAPQTNTLPALDEIRYPEAFHIINSTKVPQVLSGPRRPLTGERKKILKQSLDEVSRWLDAWNCTEKHNNTLKLHREGTCKWFTNTVAFKDWWRYRNRFCGYTEKPVVESRAWTIEHLKSKLRDGEILVFFYGDFRNKRSTSSTEAMRSILSQLLHQILDRGRDPEDLPNAIIERKCQGTLMLNDLDHLYKLVSDVVLCFRYEPIIVVDALDECTDVVRLLDVLVRLCRVRVLVTSRPDPTILDHLRTLPLPSLSFQEVHAELAKDIDLHVRRELDSDTRLRIADLTVKDQMLAELTTKADGRFRWVQCQLDILKRCATKGDLRELLDNLPTDLDATYGRILGEIDERKSELARRALAWIVAASEPLQLSQIVDGLSFDHERGRIDVRIQRLARGLPDVLSILVKYSEEKDILELSHFSVKEYLMGSMALPQYRITPHDAHTEVIQTCMSYVSVFLDRARSNGNITSLESSPLFSYVLSSGFNHLALVNPSSPVILEALKSLEWDIRCYPTYWDRLCEVREEFFSHSYLPWPSSRHDVILYLLISYSSPEVLQSFLSVRALPKQRVGTNPLVYAADLRKTEHAMTLLASGADVRAWGLVMDDSHKALPLDVAIDRGEDVLVEEFLERGSVVTSDILSTAICMPWCSTRVLVKLLRTHEFAHWAKEMGDAKLYRSVFSSARPSSGDRSQIDADHVALARRLREVGQNLSADISFGQELVERALRAGHTSMLELLLPCHQSLPAEFLLVACTGDTPETVSIVRFLLDRGIDVHAISGESRDTALHIAAMCHWERRSLELATMLIEAGCSPHARDSRGTTPLTIAMEREHFSVTEHMLSCSVSSPAAILPFALQQQATLQMIKFLIRRGIDVHSTASNGDTLLHLAATGYHESACLELFKSFAEAGCSLTIPNSHGEIPLDAAIRGKHASVVEWLLSRNVPLSPDSLTVALQQQADAKIVRHLIRRGADVQGTTSNGDTVVHIAISAGYGKQDCLGLLKGFAKAGCRLTIPNSHGETPLDVAIRKNHTVVEWLLSQNVPVTPASVTVALQNQANLQMICRLIYQCADLRSTMPSDRNEDTVVHLAITAGYDESDCLDLLKSFAEAGCSLTTPNSRGEAPLDVVIREYYDDFDGFKLMKWLLALNVPLSPRTLTVALQAQMDVGMVSRLVHLAGADLQSTTPLDEDTVVHLAIAGYHESDCLDLLKIFVEAGCSLKTTNSSGSTPLEIAIQRGYTSVVNWLISQNVPLNNAVLIALQSRNKYQDGSGSGAWGC
ncbi:ankyrin repeat-containing domain protein [Chiua virens]|nr:ankyrin repeat-containing domain protein [Chiua virens]